MALHGLGRTRVRTCAAPLANSVTKRHVATPPEGLALPRPRYLLLGRAATGSPAAEGSADAEAPPVSNPAQPPSYSMPDLAFYHGAQSLSPNTTKTKKTCHFSARAQTNNF